ncbi:hypothetical protein [Rhodovibrio salinarum]|uniref:Uncharacterized protein n=1 Tax=Rhodovibrio salinarum TaxID=1087 RepID=A0A934V0R7_9PROT|nr:hypothetical protein [Rhodovibrio salinarum]MBK1698592.1 hypothetical protein [Rhodovibrio salinarum]
MLLAIALTGCGELPRPFKPETKGDNALLLLPDRTGVAVGSVTGDLPHGAAMARAMAEALRRENVPADVGVGNRRTHWLLGAAEVTGRGNGQVARRFVWELYDANGDPVTTVTRSVSLPADDWRAGASETLQQVASRAAPEIAAALQGPAPESATLPGFPEGTQIAITEVTGRPAELARALTGAMAAQLRQRGLPLTDRPGTDDVVLTGKLVTDQMAGAGGQRLQVTWVVRRQGADARLGDLRQANAVPRAQLAAPQRLAQTIAGAAVPGVLQVLREAGR